MCNGGPCKTKEERLKVIHELGNFYEVTGRPCLDDFTLDQDKMMDVWAAIHFNPVICGRILFPDRPPRYVSVTQDLGSYASNKATAMRCRIEGNIQSAIVYETICNRIYENLPDWARW